MGHPSDYSIEAENLTRRYGRLLAIKDLTFSVRRGEVVGFLGPNGAGKSTTMRILSGLMPATSGIARVCGIPVASHVQGVKRRLGFMPENNPLPEEMRVIEYLRFRARLKGLHGRVGRKAIEDAMEACELQRTARRKIIGTLSKGFRQRVGIADAILGDPEVIIMDEPTIGLDPHQVIGIRNLIDSLRGRMTLVISSHILAEVELICDRVIIINQGHIVASGRPEELRDEFFREVRYRLEIAGKVDVLTNILRKIDPGVSVKASVREDTDGFVEVIAETRDMSDLSETMIQSVHEADDLRLRSFQRVKPSLEDIFLAATRKSWKESHTPGQTNPGFAPVD